MTDSDGTFSEGAEDGRSYRLISVLGGGGFGSVFRGELVGASGFSKQVAIKLLNEEASKVQDFKARLRDEARLLALLRHRAIVHVEDLVRIEGRWAVVMEFVEGVDLKDLMALGPMPARPLCELISEVASALQVAHEAMDPRTGQPLEIVHRDIKPANIRVTVKGEVKVLDFGVARAAFDEREAETRSLAFGSMGYLAPERFDGRDSPSSDLYALAVVVIEALLGRHLGQLSVNPRSHDDTVDAWLEETEGVVGEAFAEIGLPLLKRMLAYEAEERPHTQEVSETFQDLILEVSGPWLKRWMQSAQSKIQMPERVVTSRQVELASGSRVLPKATQPTPELAASPSSVDTIAQSRRRPGLWMAGGVGAFVIGAGLAVLLGGRSAVDEPQVAPSVADVVEEVPEPEPPPEAPDVSAEGEEEEPEEVAPAPVSSGGGKPAVTKTPEPKPAAVSDTGTVVVSGDVWAAKLRGSDGKIHRPGRHIVDVTDTTSRYGFAVAPGTYDLMVSFPEGTNITLPGAVKLQAGKTVVFRCDKIAQSCR